MGKKEITTDPALCPVALSLILTLFSLLFRIIDSTCLSLAIASTPSLIAVVFHFSSVVALPPLLLHVPRLTLPSMSNF